MTPQCWQPVLNLTMPTLVIRFVALCYAMQYYTNISTSPTYSFWYLKSECAVPCILLYHPTSTKFKFPQKKTQPLPPLPTPILSSYSVHRNASSTSLTKCDSPPINATMPLRSISSQTGWSCRLGPREKKILTPRSL